MAKTIDVRVKNKYATKEKWDNETKVALAGELIIDAPSENVGARIRIGDGSTSIKNLPAIYQLETVPYEKLENLTDAELESKVLSAQAGKQLKKEVAQASSRLVDNKYLKISNIGSWGNEEKSLALLISLSTGEVVLLSINGTSSTTTAAATRLVNNESKISKIYYHRGSSSIYVNIPSYSGVYATVTVLSNKHNDYTPQLDVQPNKPSSGTTEVKIFELAGSSTGTTIGNDSLPVNIVGSALTYNAASVVTQPMLSAAIQDFITVEEIPSTYVTESELSAAIQDFITVEEIPSEYVTETELSNKGYLTSVPSTYALKADIPDVSGKLDKAGGTMTGNIVMGDNAITFGEGSLLKINNSKTSLEFASKDLAFKSDIPTNTEKWTLTILDSQGNTTTVDREIYYK